MTYRRFKSLFGAEFGPEFAGGQGLNDAVSEVQFRETLLATFGFLYVALTKLGFEIPSSGVATIVRSTPSPAVLAKQLASKRVRLIWLHHAIVADALEELFVSPNEKAREAGPPIAKDLGYWPEWCRRSTELPIAGFEGSSVGLQNQMKIGFADANE